MKSKIYKLIALNVGVIISSMSLIFALSLVAYYICIELLKGKWL